MIPEFKAALFDMDGTLLATMRYWRLTTIEVLLARRDHSNAGDHGTGV